MWLGNGILKFNMKEMNILRDDKFESIINVSAENCSEVELKRMSQKSQKNRKLECCTDQPHGTLNKHRMMTGFRWSNEK